MRMRHSGKPSALVDTMISGNIPTDDTFKHWKVIMVNVTTSLRLFEDLYGGQLVPEEEDIFDKGGASLMTVGDAKFNPEFKSRPEMEALIGRISRLCDLMAEKFSRKVDMARDRFFEHTDSVIQMRIMLAGVPPRAVQDKFHQSKYCNPQELVRYHEAAVRETGGSILTKLGGVGLPIM